MPRPRRWWSTPFTTSAATRKFAALSPVITISPGATPTFRSVDVDLEGDRCLVLAHAVHDGVLLDEANAHAVLEQLSTLWHYGIRLEEIDATTDRVLKLTRFLPSTRA